jgi:hypothetical protein
MGEHNTVRRKATWIEAAEIILNGASRPLHAAEIVTKAISRGLVSPEGKTPDHTLTAIIWMDLHKRRKSQSPFIIVGSGTARRYWLKKKPRI